MQESLFELTPSERMNFSGAGRFGKAPPEYRLRQARQKVISDLYSQFPDLGLGQQYRQPDYDPSITIPAFNAWVDRQWEKKLAQVQAMRTFAKLAESGPNAVDSSTEDDANGEVLR